MDIFWLFLPFTYIYLRYERLSYGRRKTNHRIRSNRLDWAKYIGAGSSERGANLLFMRCSGENYQALAALAREFHPRLSEFMMKAT